MSDNTLMPTWEEVRKEICTPEELAAADLEVSIVRELLETKETEKMSFYQQGRKAGMNKINAARFERNPEKLTIEDVLKLLAMRGKTLKVVPIEYDK